MTEFLKYWAQFFMYFIREFKAFHISYKKEREAEELKEFWLSCARDRNRIKENLTDENPQNYLEWQKKYNEFNTWKKTKHQLKG